MAKDTDGQTTGDAALRLHAFFRHRASALNLFCTDACGELKPRQRQLRRFFRGSYAMLPDGRRDGAGKPGFADIYAAHATAYFTDASYRCRYPLTAGQLERAWQFAAAPPHCAAHLPFLVTDDEGRRELRWIDPARVHAVHLVFAGASGASLSRFGHVALRLVLCGEHRQRVDADCEEDVFDHLSLSFMAGIDELDLSLWKGISGGYPVKLYARHFISAYREYSIDEFRSLHSLPLRLSPDARDFMVRALSQVHWSYQNEYRFFTRNCATELQWLLQAVYSVVAPGARAFLERERFRPDRLFSDARQSPHFEGAVLEDLTAAEKGGYFFPGAKAYYQVAVNVFRDHPQLAQQDTPQTPEDWRLRSALSRRDALLLPALSAGMTEDEPQSRRDDKTGAAYTAQAGLVLEAWVARRLRREVLAVMTTYYGTLLQELIANGSFFTEDEVRLVQGCMRFIKTGDKAGTLASGVPQDAIASAPDEQVCDAGSPALVPVIKRFHDAFPLRPELRLRIRELEDTAENIRLLAQRYSPG
ncbi:MAG: DUF4105 domain-containing protein [Moraxellaceae bacterium]|nr:DUF4105 domain-containing protein [Moraxellaceae bacterium]